VWSARRGASVIETKPFEVPPPAPELRILEPLVGTWSAEEETRESVLGTMK
jgi:hypothetical protein